MNAYTKILGNGVVGNAIYSTNATDIGIKLAGDLDGGTVSLFEWYGDGTPDLAGSEWELFATITAASVGSDGIRYTIGMDTSWYAAVTGAGSPDAYFKVWDILR